MGRYDDEGEKAYKLNVERQNGRGAMLGITGCLIHELLGVDALYPTGGFDGAAGAAHQQPQLLLGLPLVRLDASLGAQSMRTNIRRRFAAGSRVLCGPALEPRGEGFVCAR